MSIKASELILNPDGSVYHLNLRPEHLATTIITVGDPDRVDSITKHFTHKQVLTKENASLLFQRELVLIILISCLMSWML